MSAEDVREGGGEVVCTGAHDCVIVVDVQNDFCPGGALPVPGGDEIVPAINRVLPLFARWVFTRDWHPAGHVSFAGRPDYRDLSWPPHCVQGTPGAEWCKSLDIPMNAVLLNKGDDPAHESYSGFRAPSFDLAGYLRALGVERLFVCGLALDYCVRQTALDAREAGFTVYLLEDAVRAITPETGARALAELEAAGVLRVSTSRLANSGGRP